MMADELLNAQDLITAKKHDTFHSEVVTGKAGGLSTGANIDYATNAVTAQVQKTLPKILDDLDWSYVGLFADGVTFTDKTDFAVDTVGTQWIYTGLLPFSATAGTVPSEPTYQAVHVRDHNQTTNRDAVGAHDTIYSRKFSSVAECIAYSGHSIGLRYTVEDYYGGVNPSGSGILFFNVVAAGAGLADGGQYIDIPGGLYQLKQNLKKPYDTKAWGARHDFDPSTGIGTDNRPFIQATINYVQSLAGGGEITMQGGDCYLGTDLNPDTNLLPSVVSNLGIQLLIGSIWSEGKDYVNNIRLIGQGTNLYAGRAGRMLTIGKSKGVTVSGLNFYHYVGGVITGQRGISDNAIRVCDGSQHIDLTNNYMTNHLGWGVDITGDSEDPSTNNYLCSNINVYKNFIKTRYGNGTRAYNTLAAPSDPQGTGGAWCIAIINGENINIYDNDLIGDIDLENNTTSQTFNNIDIFSNRFKSGWVTPQTTIGTDYWHDEPTNPVGTLDKFELRQGVLFNGVGLDADPRNIRCRDNTFENAYFLSYSKYRMAITGNTGYRGRIEVGYYQDGEQITDGAIVTDNYADVTPDTKGFISIAGLLTNSKITNNGVKDIASVPTISLDNPSGRSLIADSNYENNRLKGKTSVTAGNTYRVTVTPFMTPVCTFNTAVYLSGGAGSGVLSLYCAGLGKTGTTQTYDVVELAKGTPAGTVSFSAVTKFADGIFYFDVTVSASAGEMSFSSPDSYAIIDVTIL